MANPDTPASDVISQLAAKYKSADFSTLMDQLADLQRSRGAMEALYESNDGKVKKKLAENPDFVNALARGNQNRPFDAFTAMPAQQIGRFVMPLDPLVEKIPASDKASTIHMAEAKTLLKDLTLKVNTLLGIEGAYQLAQQQFASSKGNAQEKQVNMLRTMLAINKNTSLQKEVNIEVNYFNSYLKSMLVNTYPNQFSVNVRGEIVIEPKNYGEIHAAFGVNMLDPEFTIDPAKFNGDALDVLYKKDPNPLWMALKSSIPAIDDASAKHKIGAYIQLATLLKDGAIGEKGKYLAALNLAKAAFEVAKTYPKAMPGVVEAFGPDSVLGKWIIGKHKDEEQAAVISSLSAPVVKPVVQEQAIKPVIKVAPKSAPLEPASAISSQISSASEVSQASRATTVNDEDDDNEESSLLASVVSEAEDDSPLEQPVVEVAVDLQAVEINKLKENLAALQVEHQQLLVKFEAQVIKSSDLTATSEGLTAANAKLTDQATALTQRISELTTNLKAITLDNTQSSKQQKQLQTTVDGLQKKSGDLATSLQQAMTTNTALTQENLRLSARVSELEPQLEQAKSALADSARTMVQNKQTHNQAMDKLNQQVKGLRSELGQSQQAGVTLASDKEALTSQMAQLEQRVQTLTSHQVDETQQSKSEITELRQQIQSLRTQLSEANAAHDLSSGQLAAIQPQVVETTNALLQMTLERDALREQVAEYEADAVQVVAPIVEVGLGSSPEPTQLTQQQFKDSLRSHRQPPISFQEFSAAFKERFTGTNSDGIKRIMTCMDQQNSMVGVSDETKFERLGSKMQEEASSRLDSKWSKSHIFGKGRSPEVQALYDIMAKPNFTLTGANNNLNDIHQKIAPDSDNAQMNL